MYDKYTYEKVQKLVQEYELKWGIKLNIHNLPYNTSPEEFLKIMSEIVITGESLESKIKE